MNAESSRSMQSSGLSLLVEWANGQDHWIRKLVGDVIETRRPLSDERIADLYERLLREKELTDGDAVVLELLAATGAGVSMGTPLRLVSLRHVANVNALAANQEIECHPRLTICFGENASGKTGYVRILKRAAAVRTAEPVLPNIHASTASGPPQAEIKVLVGDEERTIEWQGEQGVEPLTRVDVFDARAAVVHLAEDLSYSYTPADLSLFPLVTEAIERVRMKLQAAREEREPRGNQFLNHFQRESRLYVKVEGLGPSTDLRELELLGDLSDEEEAALPGLRDKVEALRSGTVRQQISQAREQRHLFATAQRIADLIVRFDREAYERALSALHTAQAAHEQAAREALENESVPGVLGDAWRQFIEAAERYIQEMGLDLYPRSGEPCVYCRQPLGDPAAALLRKYRDYCNDALRQAVDRARERLRALAAPLCELAVEEAASAVQHLLQVLEDPGGPPPPLASARTCLAHAQRVQEALAAEQQCPPLTDELRDAPAVLTAAVESLGRTLEDLQKRGEERERALAQEQARLLELEARLTLRSRMPKIREYVEAARWANRAATHLARFQGTKRSLTETAKRASSDVMNREFKECFERECEALHAPRVNLDFPGREGEARRRKLLTPGHGLEEILSEGEQKVIALADFLAEASLKPDRSPIVFDDPVTSLDHKRLSNVVDRIVDLSWNRQVIVFTHDILFAAELLARFEREPSECAIHNVATLDGTVGTVVRDSHPRTDSFKDRGKRVKRFIDGAEKETGETRQALVDQGYAELRGACEVLVEKELLRGVTERYRPNVRMTVLDQIRAERLPAAFAGVSSVFERCCRTPLHSQPLPALGVSATLEELKEDWERLKKIREEYLN